MFSDVWSENAALFERFMEIHSNPPILPYVPKKITIRLSASITSKVLNESK